MKLLTAKSKFIVSNVPKYYVQDNGFYLVNSVRHEKGKQFEFIIAQKLFREGKVYYWKDKNEVDFITDNKAFNVVCVDSLSERVVSVSV